MVVEEAVVEVGAQPAKEANEPEVAERSVEVVNTQEAGVETKAVTTTALATFLMIQAFH